MTPKRKWNHCFKCGRMFSEGDVVLGIVTRVYPPRRPWYRIMLGFWEYDSEPIHLDCDKAKLEADVLERKQS